MSNFRTKYEHDKRIRVMYPAGTMTYERKGWVYNEGQLEWVTKETVPFYAKMQAERDLVELRSILKRYEDVGESALNKVESMYMDTVDLPKNYAELYDAVSRANDVFSAMPVEIKEKYGNNAATFWKNYGTEAFDDLVNAYRADIYKQYGMVDDNPVNTVKDFENDRRKVEQGFKEDRAAAMEVKDEQKSE